MLTAVSVGMLSSDSHDNSGAETLPPLEAQWKDFLGWIVRSGIAAKLIMRFPMIETDSSSGTVAQRLVACGMPGSMAESLMTTFLRDQSTGALVNLNRDPNVVNIAHLGSGASSDVFAGIIVDAAALQHDAAQFARIILGEDQPAVTEWVTGNITRVMDGTGLAVTKVLRNTDANTTHRAGRELRTSLRHGKTLPIPAILGGKMDGNDMLFHMEHMPGIDMEHLMDSWGLKALPMRFAAEFAALASRAMTLTARARLVHRDIKPANFLIGHDGRFRMLDLGFVRSVDHQSLEMSAEGGTGPGTPDYISPEVARGQDPTPAADVFSLGLVLTRMFTGNTPYRGKGGGGIATLVAHMGITPDQLPPELTLPSEFFEGEDVVRAGHYGVMVKRMLQSMIHPDPQQRPSPDTVADFFRRYSSFGSLQDEREFMNAQANDDLRLATDPPPVIAEGDVPLSHAYKSDGHMMQALIDGAKKRAGHYDFLASPEFGGEEQKKEQEQERQLPIVAAETTPKKRYGLVAGVVGGLALTAAGVAFVMSRSDTTSDIAVVPTQPSAKDPKPPEVIPDPPEPEPVVVEKPREPERNMALRLGADGPEELRMFRHESLVVPRDQLMALYAGQGKESEVNGAGFVCTAKDIAALLKLGDVAQLPEAMRLKCKNMEEAFGGVMGIGLRSSNNAFCTHITGFGTMFENAQGMVLYSDHPEFTDARKADCLRVGGYSEMLKDDIAQQYLLHMREITGTGMVSPSWQKLMADPKTFSNANSQFLHWRSMLQKEGIAAKN